MKKLVCYIIIISIILGSVFIQSSDSYSPRYYISHKKVLTLGVLPNTTNKIHIKIYVVNSYSPQHPCTAPQVTGFLNELQLYTTWFTFDIRTIYLKTKIVNTTPEKMEQVAQIAIQQINQFKPDFVVTTDDNAFTLVGIPVSISYPVVGSGLNRPAKDYIKSYHLTQKNKIYFIQERINLTKFWHIIKDNEIFFNKIVIFVEPDDMLSVTGYYMLQNYIQEFSKKYDSDYINIIRIRSASDLRQELIQLNKEYKENILLVVAGQRIYDDDGRLRNKLYYVKLVTQYNKNFLELGGNNIFCRYGLSVCVAPSFRAMGNKAADIVGEYLLQKYYNFKSKYKDLAIIDATNIVAVNEERLLELNYYKILYSSNLIDIIFSKRIRNR